MHPILRLFTVCAFLIPAVSFAQDTEHEKGIYKFIQNGGQWPDGVLYRADVEGGRIWLEKKGVLYQFIDASGPHRIHHEHSSDPKDTMIYQHLLYAEFVGANENFATEQKYPSSEYYNYFLGNDPTKWASKMYGYSHITYKELYSGIDLLYLEKDQDLKYEYHVIPGANPNQIKVKYYGQDKIKLTKEGNLSIETSLGKLTEQKPYAYQIKNGKIIEISCNFVLSKNNEVSYQLGNYDTSLELVIDPVLVFATYNGAFSDNFGMTATYAYDGKAYTGGTIYGNSYPITGPAWDSSPNFTSLSGGYGITDVFISKYSADGTTMLWTNFVGGGDNFQGTETVHSLICDNANNIYLYGATSSTDFPLMNAYQNVHAGGAVNSNYYYNGIYFGNQGTDIYVTKLSEDGTMLLGSTYVGGSANDGVNYRIAGGIYDNVAAYDSLTSNYGDQFRGEIMLDSMNNILIASSTRSTDFPVLNSFQNTIGGQQDGVVFKLSSDFSALMWSTYFGGSSNDACYSIKIDSSYNVLFAGGTSSNNIPGAVGGLNPTYMGGKTDGFVAKVSPDGSTLVQSTYIGTPSYDQTIFVEIDRWDNVYILGQSSGNMPVINAAYSNPNSGQYIMKLAPTLQSVVYATKFGNGNGTFNISPAAFLVDVCGNVYVSGWGANILQTVSLTGMPVTPDAIQPSSSDGFNFYLFVLERDANSLLYASYLGSPSSKEHVDGGTSRFDKFGVVYQSVCGGCSNDDNFPTTPGAWSSVNNSSNCNNVVFKFDFEIVPVADFEVSQVEGCAPFLLDLANESTDTVNSVWTFPPEAIVISGGANPQLLFTTPGTYEIIISITDTICNLQDTAKKIITVYDALLLEIPDDTVICDFNAFDLIANSFGTATGFIWDDDPDFSSPLATGMDSVITVNPSIPTTYYVTATNGWPLCDIVDSVKVWFVDGAVDVMNDTTICPGGNVFLHAENLVPAINMTFDWAPNSALTSESGNTATASPPSSMYFYFTATTDLGCVYQDSVFVTVTYIDPNTIYATATPDTIPEGGTSILNVSPNGYSYLWNPPFGLNDPSLQSPTATVDQTSIYEVTIFDGPCSYKTSVLIYTYEFICGDVYIFVPNAFSPNGDNLNDKVFVRGKNIIELDFKIFDRWGEMVFSTTDQSIGWDGTFKGELLDPDVYVYHLKVICFDEQENLIKGNITLLR